MAHMIRPFHLWLADVGRILETNKDCCSFASPYWFNCYRNNQTPMDAVAMNYDYCVKIVEPKHYDFVKDEYNTSPYAGIGDTQPYRQYER